MKELISNWEGCEDYLPRLEYLERNASEIGKRCYIKQEPGEGYNVLNHGDFHTRNILSNFNSDNRLEEFQFVTKLILST